jgi:DNA primase
MAYTGPRLGQAAMQRVKAEHSLVDVLARMGIDPPPRWDGHSHFRVPAAALGFPYGRDDSQGVLIKPEENRWWAFHGGFGGDVLELVRRVTGTSLWKAAKTLDSRAAIAVDHAQAARGGRAGAPGVGAARAVTTSEQPDLDRTPVDRVFEINAEAWRYLTLPKLADRARGYLKRRGIDVTALEAEVGEPLAGHTPMSRTGLVDYLRKKGFTDDETVDSGWGVRRPGEQLRDKYHHRVLIPFRDEQGRVVGVTGRDLTDRANAKYLNHPRTLTFDKSAALYRPSTPALDEHATVIACEGTLDALAIASAAARVGASTKLAPCTQSGLSLTNQAAAKFFGLHHRPPVLCGDGDGPGQKATEEWVDKAMRIYHREVLTLTLPQGLDPAEWLTKQGDLGLITFTRHGCLADDENVRPKPAGGLLARRELHRAIEIARQADPDVETVTVAPLVINKLGKRAVDLAGEDARRRFADAAGAELARLMDGGAAEQRASQVLASIERAIERSDGASAAQAERPNPVGRW